MNTYLERAFDEAELEAAGDGRTIVGRCVPFDAEALVSDGGPPYREVWRAGAFRHVLKAPHLVGLNFEHGRGLGEQVGRALELEERGDGLYGTFRALSTVFGDQGLELVREGGVRGLSVAVTMHERGTRESPGCVERVRVAKFHHVALTGSPAFAGAEVTAVRSDISADKNGAFVTPTAPALAEVLDWAERSRARFPATS